MDPVSLIVAALAAGAVAGAENTATQAVKDAYGGLKAIIRRLVSGRASAETALERHEAQPQAWEGALTAELAEADAGADPDAVVAAQQVMRLLDEAGSRAGKYVVHIEGGQGVQVGDLNTQTNTFTTPPPARDYRPSL
jgi:hypothetical protein